MVVSLVRDADLEVLAIAPDRSYEGDLRVLSVGRLDEEKNPLHKYTRFKVRKGKPPTRRDLCVVGTTGRPSACPRR